MDEIVIKEFNDINLNYNTQNNTISIDTGETVWTQRQDITSYIEIKDTVAGCVKLLFCNAENIKNEKWVTGYGQGIKTTYSKFKTDTKEYDITIKTLIWLDNFYGDLHMELIPINESDIKINTISWPVPFQFDKITDSYYTVIPMKQGCIVPNNYNKKVDLIGDGGLYMPWWGQIKDRQGYIAVVETPFDVEYKLLNNEDGSYNMQNYWKSSLNKIGYTRKIKYSFVNDCDYNDLCKVYRRYAKEQGLFVTLKEKAARCEQVNRLIGCPVIHEDIYVHIKPISIYYNKKEPEKNDHCVSFDERSRQLRKLKDRGIEKAYLHLDGWGKRGYDNLHPDVLPPCERAGGWNGMKRLSDTCKDIDYIFGIHDQYRDYYLDAETYDESLVVIDGNGNIPREDIWYGGEQAKLCTTFAPYYLKRNHEKLSQNGVELKGCYLDCFSVTTDECIQENHKMTREESVDKRMECFQYLKSKDMIVSSEEPVAWAIPLLDLVHHGPYAIEQIASGLERGIPVPLFNLVFHECIVLPWVLTDKGGWGIPDDKSGFLYALLNGGTGYLSIDADDEEIKKNKIVSNLQKRIANEEMIKHEFIDGNYNKQRTVFANKTVVEVNFEEGKYYIYNQ